MAGLTQADTVYAAAVLRTGPLVAICELVPSRVAAPPDQVTAEAAAVLPVPEESVTVVPEVWLSFHQPTGCPVPSAATDREVSTPIGSASSS